MTRKKATKDPTSDPVPPTEDLVADPHVLGAAPGLVRSLGLQMAPVSPTDLSWERLKLGLRVCIGPYIVHVSTRPYGVRAWKVSLPSTLPREEPRPAPPPNWRPAPPVDSATPPPGVRAGPPRVGTPPGVTWGGKPLGVSREEEP